MKRIKFEVEYEFDFILLGITSGQKEYKLAWELNRELTIELKKSDDCIINFKGDSKLIISTLTFSEHSSIYTLLKNRSVDYENTRHSFLLPELKQFDYFLKLEGVFEPELLIRIQDR